MPEYKYLAEDDNGRKIRDVMAATDIATLENRLLQRRLYLLDCEEMLVQTASGKKKVIFSGRVPMKERATFLKMIKVFLEAGISLNGALSETYDATKHANMKSVISGLRTLVEDGGETLAGAMSEFPHVFDAMVVESVRMGEESGTLPQILEGQAVRLEKEAAIRSKIVIQSIQPIVTLIAVIALLILLNVSVIPKLMDAYKDFLPSGNLPPKTAVIMAINGWLMDWGLIIPAIMIVITIFWVYCDTNQTLKLKKDQLKFKLPVLQDFIVYAELTRISDGLYIGANSGLPVSQILQFLEKHVSNLVVAGKIRSIREDVGVGMTLAQAARQNHLDHVFTAMISTGEKTGDLPHTMTIASAHYAEKLETMITVLSILMGFIVLIIMGVIVFFAMVSAMVPMYELPTVLN